MFKTILLALMPMLFYSTALLAHPVSFQNSTGIMGHHAPNLSHNQINHSFKYWFALGLHHFRKPNSESNTHASHLSTNFLLKRWNGPALQANIYGVLGIGQSELSGTSKQSGLSLLQFDIEDRKYYFLAKHMQLFNKGDSDLAQSTIRVGIAPYVEKYEGLHSWLILEWQSTDMVNYNNNSGLTPFLRVFYRNLLFEIGQSFNGLTRFNYISHF